MDKDWLDCKNILCIRADNMGDLLMSSPAIRALKETFKAKITVLTSSMAKGIAKQIPEIDDIVTYDLPWVKTQSTFVTTEFFKIIEEIKNRNFDAAVIFTVYSQNPLPAAMLAYLAEIPLRLGYCRENAYELINYWVPDREPYSEIKHQVQRDLDLVATVGAYTSDDEFHLADDDFQLETVQSKLSSAGVLSDKPWVILHPGVSEKKREYPRELWVQTAKKIIRELGYQVLFTGATSEKTLAESLSQSVGEGCFSVAGLFNLNEFIVLIKAAPLVISVNTGTIHLAAAVKTPVVVLYALTNPQHFPWRATGKVFLFDVPQHLKSKNEIIRYVNDNYFAQPTEMVDPDDIVNITGEILSGNLEKIPELPIDTYINQ